MLVAAFNQENLELREGSFPALVKTHEVVARIPLWGTTPVVA